MWQSPPSSVKMVGCRTHKVTLRSLQGAWASRPRLMHYEIYTPTPPQSSNIESALIYAYFMSGVIKKHFLTLTIYFFSSFMLNSAKLFVLLRSETDSKMDIKDFI